MINNFLGAIPSELSEQDYLAKDVFAPSCLTASFPSEFLISNRPEVYHQTAQDCVSYGLGEERESTQWKETGVHKRIATGFIYGMRDMGSTSSFPENSYGMGIKTGLIVLNNYGVPYFEDYPILGEFPVVKVPGRKDEKELYEKAKVNKLNGYVLLKTAIQMKAALMNLNAPLLFGTAVAGIAEFGRYYITPEYRESLKKSGVNVDGSYHCMAIIGWTKYEGREYFIVQNSWGKDWGINGLWYFATDYGWNQKYLKGTYMEVWSPLDFVPDLFRCQAQFDPKKSVVELACIDKKKLKRIYFPDGKSTPKASYTYKVKVGASYKTQIFRFESKTGTVKDIPLTI